MNIERPKIGYYNQKNRLNPSAAESQARYAFAAEHISRSLTNGFNLVGDFSCGIGESTIFLEESLNARKDLNIRMMGADIDCDSVAVAIGHNKTSHLYSQLNLGEKGLRSKISSMNNSIADFDGVACIETIEHITPAVAADILLTNLYHLLIQKEGTLVISSPNRRFFANNRYNPYSKFHTQEFNPDEFGEILDRSKFNFEIFAQRPVSSSLVKAFDGLRKLADSTPKYRRHIGKVISMSSNVGNLNPSVVAWSNDGKTVPKYLVAVCRPR